MDVVWVIVIGILVLLVILVIFIFKSMTRIVPQESRWVIYRLGRFNRIVGPGPVQIVPFLDKVQKVIEARDHPIEITVPGLIAFGVPNDLTFNFWCCTDLRRAAGDDREKLVHLAQLNDVERRQQIEVKLRQAVVRQIASLQQRHPLSQPSRLMDGVIALAPGSPRYNELLEGLKRDLEQELPLIGVILNTAQPVAITKRMIAPDIVKALQRKYGREIDSQWLREYAQELQQNFPGISRAVLAQMLASVEGVDVGRMQRMLLEHEGSHETNAELEIEMSGDSTGTYPNLIAKPKLSSKKKDEDDRTAPVKTPGDSTAAQGLTESDLGVLKRVPRRNEARLSA